MRRGNFEGKKSGPLCCDAACNNKQFRSESFLRCFETVRCRQGHASQLTTVLFSKTRTNSRKLSWLMKNQTQYLTIHSNYYYTTSVYGLFSRTTWVSRYQKGKPFWILLDQEMMGWQWYQLDHMQIICTSLQTDNHATISPLSFLQVGCPACRPTNRVKALKAINNFFKYRNFAPAQARIAG